MTNQAMNDAFKDTYNPMETDGFEFLEFTTLEPDVLANQFKQLGFTPVAKHRSKNITLFKQGEINFLLNAEKDGLAHELAKLHGPSVCGMGFRIKDAATAFERAKELGAKPYQDPKRGSTELNIPAIYGIGDSLIYFIDRYGDRTIYEIDYVPLQEPSQQPAANNAGLTYIDHLTHNVHRGQMDKWAEFYERLFNFREIRYFDIEGKLTGLTSKAMTSPCGKIRIPLNQSSDDKSQIEEFLHEFHGEGIQHVALGTSNIYTTVEKLRSQQIKFLDVPDTYYDMVENRLPRHGEDLARLAKNRIIIDGNTKEGEPKLLLQIFTANMLGPVFFEIIQRKGDEGFGEGNFKALFESMELDQIRRGVLKA